MRNIIFLKGVIFIKLLQRTLHKNLNLTLKKKVAKTLQKVLDKRLGNINFIRNCGSIIELTDKALFLVNMSRTSYLGPRRRVPAKELDFFVTLCEWIARETNQALYLHVWFGRFKLTTYHKLSIVRLQTAFLKKVDITDICTSVQAYHHKSLSGKIFISQEHLC